MRPPLVSEIQRSLIAKYNSEFARYSQAPVGATSVKSRELVKPSFRSTECLHSATGNCVKLPGALYIMTAWTIGLPCR